MAVGTYALTSLSNLKDWIGITSSTDDAVLESAIDRATDVVERFKVAVAFGGFVTPSLLNSPTTLLST